MPSATTIPNARAFVRSLNVLLKFARLYGLEHVRSASQFDSAFEELTDAIGAAGPAGLLLGATGSQLLLDGVPLETTPAERSFANLLSASGIASICFGRGLERHEFAQFIRAFMETGTKSKGLAEKLSEFSGKDASGAIRVNEIRFVAEDSAYSEARVAAQLTVRTLGGDADSIQEWFRSPEKMIQLIAAAEGAAHPGGGPGGGSGDSTGNGSGSGSAPATNTGSYAGAVNGPGNGAAPGAVAAPGAPSGGGSFGFFGGLATAGSGSAAGSGGVSQEPMPISEAEMHSLLRLLAQFGEATQGTGKTQNLDQSAWQQKLAHLPQNAQVTLRQALAGVMATAPKAKLDGTTLVRLAEDLAIRFALDRYQRGEVRVNAVRQLLDKMGQEVETLRKMLRAREDKMAKAGIAVESHADLLDRQFWAQVPESGKKQVLLSTEAWCIPPRNVQSFVEELLGRGESDAAGDILLHYAACVRNKDAEARRKAAIGLGQLAELYSRAASQRLQTALAEIGKQMQEEREQELQSLLSAAFVRLSQEAASRRYYRAMIQALDSLNLLEAVRPSWVQGLRPRLGIENRVSEFIDDAVNSDRVDDSLTDVLRRVPQASSEQLAVRLSRTTRRNERERVVDLAKAIGEPCAQPLRAALRSEPLSKASCVIGLLSRLDPIALGEFLPSRLSEGQRSFQDAVVRQLAIAGAPERGRILAALAGSFRFAGDALRRRRNRNVRRSRHIRSSAENRRRRIAPSQLRIPARESHRSPRPHPRPRHRRAPPPFPRRSQNLRLDLPRRNPHGGSPSPRENRCRLAARLHPEIRPGRRRARAGPARSAPRSRFRSSSPLSPGPPDALRPGSSKLAPRQAIALDQCSKPRWRHGQRRNAASRRHLRNVPHPSRHALHQRPSRSPLRPLAIKPASNG